MSGDAERLDWMGTLYLVASAAPAPEGISELVAQCQAAGWRVLVFATPQRARFLDPAGLERMTGEPVRTEYRMPGEAKAIPPADAVLACPLTFNSVNKFAHGHADNFAIGLLCELTGYGVPVVVVPHCKPQLASHQAFRASIAALRSMGVAVLFDPDAPYEGRRGLSRAALAGLVARRFVARCRSSVVPPVRFRGSVLRKCVMNVRETLPRKRPQRGGRGTATPVVEDP